MRAAIPDGYTCPNCGAPVTTEICEFCGSPTAVASKNADMKYPAIECAEVDDDGRSADQLVFMGGTFIGFAIATPIFFYKLTGSVLGDGGNGFMLFVCILFGIIGLIMTIAGLKHTCKHMLVSVFGKEIHGYVWGYMDNERHDGVIHGGIEDRTGGQIMKILTNTDNGPVFLLYELHHDEQPYGIKQTVTLKKLGQKYLLTGLSKKNAEIQA